jgi:hypothetical protein
MILLQETTSDWKVPTPNHIYIFGTSSSKIVGYIKAGTTVAVKFSEARGFDKRRRTFVTLKAKECRQYDLSAVQ